MRTTSQRRFGIEIECGFDCTFSELQSRLHRAGLSNWIVKTDCSVYGTGRIAHGEITSPPLRGDDGLAQIETACQVLATVNARVNGTCGLHVHHDASGLSLDAFKHLALKYLTHEGVFDSFMPAHRRLSEGGYCRSNLAHFTDVADAHRRIAAAPDLVTVAELVDQSDRYHKVNYSAYWQHGTIELRHHHGSVDAAEIVAWVTLTQGILHWAETTRNFSYVPRKPNQLGQLFALLPVSVKDDLKSYYIAKARRMARA